MVYRVLTYACFAFVIKYMVKLYIHSIPLYICICLYIQMFTIVSLAKHYINHIKENITHKIKLILFNQ